MNPADPKAPYRRSEHRRRRSFLAPTRRRIRVMVSPCYRVPCTRINPDYLYLILGLTNNGKEISAIFRAVRKGVCSIFFPP